MTNFKNPLIVCAVVVMVFLLFLVKAGAYEVSSAGGCSVPNSHPDAWRFYNTIKSFPGWTGNFYKVDTNSTEVQYKRVSLGGQNNAPLRTGGAIGGNASGWGDSNRLGWFSRGKPQAHKIYVKIFSNSL